jgi:hypothetical protein
LHVLYSTVTLITWAARNTDKSAAAATNSLPLQCLVFLIALRHGAVLAVVHCDAGDEARWQQQVEARAAAEQGSDAAHKLQGWQQIQQPVQR